MAKRDIKAKRWAKRSISRQKPENSVREEDHFFSLTQVRILGSGSVQYRWGWCINQFSSKRYRKSLHNEPWHDAE